MPPPPTITVPGLTEGGFSDALYDRKPGIYGALTPKFKTKDVLRWVQAQTAYSDIVRNQLLEVQAAEKKARKRRARRSRRSGSRSSRSRSSKRRSPSSTSAEDEKERPRLKFRLIAKEKPGVTFASMAANSRQALGQYGVELDTGRQGPLFKKWYESSFLRNVQPAKVDPYRDELLLLTTALDEFYSGRMVEVGDILASRLRMLTVGIQKSTWKAAKHFLVYHHEDLSLVPEGMMDAALKIEELELKREKKLLAGRDNGPVRR